MCAVRGMVGMVVVEVVAVEVVVEVTVVEVVVLDWIRRRFLGIIRSSCHPSDERSLRLTVHASSASLH